jgi:hypothetical protein
LTPGELTSLLQSLHLERGTRDSAAPTQQGTKTGRAAHVSPEKRISSRKVRDA